MAPNIDDNPETADLTTLEPVHKDHTYWAHCNHKPTRDDVKEQIIEAIGGFGPWQLRKCLFISLIIWIPASFHLLNMVFFRPETDHWCTAPEKWNLNSQEIWRNISSPRGFMEGCYQFDVDFDSYENIQQAIDSDEYKEAVELNSAKPCASWTYDTSFWESTIIMEWDLVCDRNGMRKWTQQATFFGLLIGVVLSGMISDKFGRTKAMVILLTMCIVCGMFASFATSYYYFLFGIWGCGFSAIGYGTVMYCWMMELIAGTEKTVFGCMPHLNFAFWGLVLAGIAYLLPNWRHMEIVFSAPLILLYSCYFVLPESPRWLLAHGRLNEAEKVLRRIAKFNKKPLPPNFKLHVNESHEKGKGILGFLELFKTPNLRKKTLIIYYSWFSTSLIYYGLTLNSNKKGSLFTYYCIGKGMEFPAIALVIILLLRTGRRITLTFLYFMCGISLISTGLIPSDYEELHIFLNVLGRGCSTGTLCLCYVYSAEIFPTVIRNVGIGSSSFWARIGPMIVPYIADLKTVYPTLPIVIFGCVALLASFLISFLPETAHHKLPDTIPEGEELGKGDNLYTWIRNKCK